MISNQDLATIFGGQAPASAPPNQTTGPTVPDADDTWKQEWEEQMKKPASWSSCVGGVWHGCTQGDRYK